MAISVNYWDYQNGIWVVAVQAALVDASALARTTLSHLSYSFTPSLPYLKMLAHVAFLNLNFCS